MRWRKRGLAISDCLRPSVRYLRAAIISCGGDELEARSTVRCCFDFQAINHLPVSEADNADAAFSEQGVDPSRTVAGACIVSSDDVVDHFEGVVLVRADGARRTSFEPADGVEPVRHLAVFVFDDAPICR